MPGFLPYEIDLLYLINGAHSPFMDAAMWLYSGMKVWILPFAAILFVTIYKHNWRQWLIVLLLLVALFGLCDFLSADIIKRLVGRPRPTDYPGVMEHIRTLGARLPGKISLGFVSSHATQSFAFTLFTALLFRNRAYTWVMVVWALVMCYSRVYLGMHFISDILGGTALGLLIGLFVYKLYTVIGKAIDSKHPHTYTPYKSSYVKALAAGIAAYTIIFSTLSTLLVTPL